MSMWQGVLTATVNTFLELARKNARHLGVFLRGSVQLISCKELLVAGSAAVPCSGRPGTMRQFHLCCLHCFLLCMNEECLTPGIDLNFQAACKQAHVDHVEL